MHLTGNTYRVLFLIQLNSCATVTGHGTNDTNMCNVVLRVGCSHIAIDLGPHRAQMSVGYVYIYIYCTHIKLT